MRNPVGVPGNGAVGVGRQYQGRFAEAHRSFPGLRRAFILRCDGTALWDTPDLKPNGLQHHSEGLASLGEPTLESGALRQSTHGGTLKGFCIGLVELCLRRA